MNISIDALKKRILAAKGEIKSDLVLKKGRVINVFSGDVQACDVAIYDGYIAGLGPEYHGKEEIELQGKWIAPGLIDGHIHIESSMLLPSRLAAALLIHGTTAIVSDPHEIANVMGLEGIKFMLQDSRSIPFDIFFMAPSCVPATHLETSGAELTAADLSALRNEPRVLGLAEMMNYPGVLMGDRDVLEKLILFQDRIIDGHGPSLKDYDLQAYLSAGIRSDHETCDRIEGREKLKSGMMLMIREGTSAKNLDELLPLVRDATARRFCFVSDDLHPRDIQRRGHLDFMISRAISLGLNPATAVQLATLNPAEYFGLKGQGAVAPGYRADLVVLDNLERFKVEKVYKAGRLVVDNGELVGFPQDDAKPIKRRPLNIPPIRPESFRIPGSRTKARIIQVTPGQIVTGARFEKIHLENGLVVSDVEKDVLKLAVVERHRATGRIGLGLVRGFGLKKGAMASSVAHDSHNVIAVGVDDSDLCLAVQEVQRMGGGMVVAENNAVCASVPLELAGLMSLAPLEQLTGQLDGLDRAASSLGCCMPEPFMQLSFLALPVIPELKLTDHGLVDVNKFCLVPLFVDDI